MIASIEGLWIIPKRVSRCTSIRSLTIFFLHSQPSQSQPTASQHELIIQAHNHNSIPSPIEIISIATPSQPIAMAELIYRDLPLDLPFSSLLNDNNEPHQAAALSEEFKLELIYHNKPPTHQQSSSHIHRINGGNPIPTIPIVPIAVAVSIATVIVMPPRQLMEHLLIQAAIASLSIPSPPVMLLLLLQAHSCSYR